MPDAPGQVTIRKIVWRLPPFIFLFLFWHFIDTANLAYAALTIYWLRVYGLPVRGTGNDQLKARNRGVDAGIL